MNVLYIVCDDFRPQISGYNISDPVHVPTPNLDKLIATGTTFKRAYAQQAVCSPSRNSFPIARRPKNTKIWNFQSDFRKTNKSWVTTPQWFKEKEGFLVNGNGKFFHPGHPPKDDEPYSWTSKRDGGWDYQDPNHQINYCDNATYSPLSCVLPEEKSVDFVLSNLTQLRLHQLASRHVETSQPFMQVVGLLKPHPFWALPQWAFDMFPESSVPLPGGAMFVDNLKDMPEPAYEACHSINGRSELTTAGYLIEPYNPLPPALSRKIRQGYFAGVVHLDRMIGNVLDTLDALNLTSSTIVALHADHGWELGERGSYCKQNTDELRTRVPLIIRDPSRPQSQGVVVDDPTELVNVFPTLVELATGAPLDYDVDGVSLAPVFNDPSSGVPPPQGFSEPLAFSVYPRCLSSSEQYRVPQGYNVTDDPCTQVAREDFSHMGLTVRSRDFRYTEWRLWDGASLTPRFDVPPVLTELYDHTHDAGESFDNNYERHNAVKDDDMKSVAERMAAYVAQQWGK